MRVFLALSLVAMALSGCAEVEEPFDATTSMEDSDGDGFIDAVEAKYGSDPNNATSTPDVMVHDGLEFRHSFSNVVGTGVPGVQCPADAVNSQTFTWTIEAPEGDVRDVHVGELEFRLQGAATVNDADLFVTTPDGNTQSATGSTASETIAFSGHQSIGDYTIEVRGCSGAGDVVVEATGMLGWTPSDADLLADGHDEVDDGHQH